MPNVAEARAALKARAAKNGAGRVGGARRVVKSAPKAAGNDDKKVQTAVKRLGVNIIPGIEHVDLIKKDGSALTFRHPKLQANVPANTFVVTGTPTETTAADVTPNLFNQMSPELLQSMIAKLGAGAGAEAGAGAAAAAEEGAPADFEAVSEE